jgi:hypothetical protein
LKTWDPWASKLTHAGFHIESIDACTTNMHAIDALEPDLIVVLGGPIGVYEHDEPVILTRLSRWETMRWHSSFIPK